MRIVFGLIFFSTLFLLLSETKAHSYDFYCRLIRDIPVTIAKTERGDIPIIYWMSDRLSTDSTPQEWCTLVSRRFQAAQDNQQLNYLSTGIVNGEQVICTSDRVGGNCVDILLPLIPGSNPREIIEQLLDLRGLANGRAIEQGNNQELYINFSEYISRIPALND